jgi:transposase
MICAGIDTGKRRLDVALHRRDERLEVKNDPDGHRRLAAWLRERGVKRVGIEASGGYEMELRRDGFKVVVFQPAQVRAYAMAHLQLAKNDKIDATLIAACTAAVTKIHAPPDPGLAPLAAKMTLIEQIGADVARHKTTFWRKSFRPRRSSRPTNARHLKTVDCGSSTSVCRYRKRSVHAACVASRK